MLGLDIATGSTGSGPSGERHHAHHQTPDCWPAPALPRRPCAFTRTRSRPGSRTSAIPILRSRCSIRALTNTASRLTSVERIAGGCRWNEGPVYFGDGRYLLWSDIPNNRIMRWDEETGRVSVFRKPSNNANGNTRDRQGRLVTCEHDTRRVTRTEYDGTITVLADKFDGKPLNSPNDVVVKSDELGLVHRSAVRHPRQLRGPCRDAGTADQCLPARQDRAAHGRDRRHQPAQRARLLARRVQALRGRGGAQPARHPGVRRHRQRHQARQQARRSSPPSRAARRTASASTSTAICGAAGAWATTQQDGVKIFDPTGKPIGFIALPERCANVCFGGVEAQPPVHGGEPLGLFALCRTRRASRADEAEPQIGATGILAIWNDCRAGREGEFDFGADLGAQSG